MKTRFFYFLSVVTILTISFIGCDSKQQNTSKTISIACNLPLTGDVAIYGTSVRDGILMAMEDLKKGGQLDTLNINFDFQDNKSNNTEAVTILNKQLLSTPNLYISGLDHETKAIIDILSQKGIPHFTYSWEPFICKKGKNNFRTGINLEQESEYYVKFIEHKKPKKLAIIHINDPGSFLQFDSLVIPEAKKVEGINIKTEVFTMETMDFKNIATKIKEYNPDAILVAGYDIHLIPLIKEFRNFNIIKEENMMCSVDLLDASNNLPSEMLENLRFTCPRFVYESNNNSEWKLRFKQKFNRDARYGDAYAYDMTNILYKVFKQANGNYDYENIINLIKGINTEGITGHLNFNENRDLNLNLSVCYYKEGNIIKESY
jgi:branched-chain amino acid transport system substrate-binding protein